MNQLKQSHPDWRFVGVGGQLSRSAGVTLWADSSLWSIVGATEALTRVPRFLVDYWRIRQRLLQTRPDFILFIDAPAVHMRLAPVMQRHGLRCAYYFPPSGWSRNGKRLKDIHSRCEALIPAFAFSAEQYALNHLPVAYFGHPLVDLCQPRSRSEALAQLGLPEGDYAALMPGSRTQEIRMLLPTFLEAAARLHDRHPQLTWLLPAANRPLGERIRRLLPDPPTWLRILEGNSRSVMMVSQAGLLSSGSATLEACLLNLPHVICYKFNPIDYFIAFCLRALGLMKIDMFGLPNLVLQDKVIPERFQHEANPQELARLVEPLLESGPPREYALAQLARVRQQLGPPGAVARVAAFVARMAQGQTRDEALA